MLKWCSRRVLTVIVIMYFILVRKGILLMFLGRISQRSANWGLQVWTFFYSLSNSNCKSVKTEQILKQSCFCDNHIVQIDSPDRLNIKIYVKCVKKKIILTLVTIFKGKMHIEFWYFAKALKTTMLSTRCSEGNVMLL